MNPLQFPLLADENINPRPGHIDPEFTIQTLMNIKHQNIDVNDNFIIIVERKDDRVNIRVRFVIQ